MKQTRKTSNVPINVEYLIEAIESTGKRKTEIAASIGRTYSFIKNAIDRKMMQRPAAELLCKLNGFDINQLCPKPVEESGFTLEPVQPEEAADEVTMQTLVEALTRCEAKLDHIIKYIKAM